MTRTIRTALLSTLSLGLALGVGCEGSGGAGIPDVSLEVEPAAIERTVRETFFVTIITSGDSIGIDTGPDAVISDAQAFYRESGGDLTVSDAGYEIATGDPERSRVRAYFRCLEPGETEVEVTGQTVISGTSFTVTCVADGQPLEEWSSGYIAAPIKYFAGSLAAGSTLFAIDGNADTVDDGEAMDHQGGSRPQRDDHTTTCSTSVIAAEAAAVTESGRSLGLTAEADPIATFPCGQGPEGFTLCPSNRLPMTDGPKFVAAHAMMSEIVVASPDRHYQYGFVFDSDGDPANNFVPLPEFAGDFFQDTDLWFVASYSPVGGWELQTSIAHGGDVLAVSINARIVISGNALVLIAPADAFASDEPEYRVTAFEHDGTWAQDPDWAGDVEPPVDQGLRPLD